MKYIIRILVFIFAAIVVAFILFMVIFYNSFKNYSEPSVGIDNNIAYENKLLDDYRLELKKINKLYFESNDPYYTFEKDLKEHIVEKCVDRYFQDNNITNVSGWRFTINVNERYIIDNKINDDFVNDKFTRNLRHLEQSGYEWTSLQQTWKIDQKIDCNKSLPYNFKSYLEQYKVFHIKNFEHKNLQWVDYLNARSQVISQDSKITSKTQQALIR